MRSFSVTFVAVVLAITVSAFSKAETAPCSGVYFRQDLQNFPEEFTVSPAHFLYTATDANNNNLPDDGNQFSSGSALPPIFSCPDIPLFVCAVAYASADVEERPSDGKWVPKANANPICVMRYGF